MWGLNRIRCRFHAGRFKSETNVSSHRQFQGQWFIGALKFSSREESSGAVVSPLIRRISTETNVIRDYSMNHPPVTISLYQYAICPFCNRVKTILDYIGNDVLRVKHVEVNPLTKSEIQLWKKLYRKVPIATVDEEAIFGSDEIIQKVLELPIVRSSLEHRWQTSSGFPMTWEQFTTSNQEWIDFSTKELAVWLYPNMCRTWKDSYRAFEYIHGKQFSTMQRFLIQNIGSLAMYFAANKIKKKHNVSDERQALQDVLVKLETALQQLNPSDAVPYRFLSGLEHPNVGDLSVYGTLRAIQDLPIYQEVIADRGGPIVEWSRQVTKEIPNLAK